MRPEQRREVRTMAMTISDNGISLIKRFEGCRLIAYKPVAAERYYTIGYGHYGKDVYAGMHITQAQADAYLRQDLAKYEHKVDIYDGTYHWSQNEFDALVSFAYNVGSIDQLTAHGTRSKQQIADKILSYVYGAGHRKLSGLVTRRKAEHELFIRENPSAGKTAETGAADNTVSAYKVGSIYHTVTRLKVRKAPGTSAAQVKHSEMDQSERQYDNARIGCIDKNTPVIPREVKKQDNSVWLRIGSGWVCARMDADVYIK
jgi:GH24 family phage-related lysozyme (muramidase)